MKRLRRFITDDRGSVAAMTAVSLLFILVLAALAVDYGHWQDTIVKMQTAADAGATAGAARLLTVKENSQGFKVEVNGSIRDVVREIATQNPIPLDEGKTVVELPDVDIKFGKWDFDNNCFASTVEPNADTNPDAIDTCEVTIRKNQEINGRLVNFFWGAPLSLAVTSRAYLGWAGKFW